MQLKHTGLVTLIALAVATSDARAQRSGYTAFLAFGASSVRTAALDDQLAGSGFPTFGSGGAAVSLGAYRVLRSGLLLGGEWHYVSLGNERHNDRQVGLGGGYATLGLAYGIQSSTRTRVYPRLGLGIGGMGLWRENDPTPTRVAFDDWLTASQSGDSRFVTLSQASMVVDFGAGAELELRRSARGPIVGVRVGYVATPFDQGWTFEGEPVSNAPSVTMAGPYVRMMIGWRRERSH